MRIASLLLGGAMAMPLLASPANSIAVPTENGVWNLQDGQTTAVLNNAPAGTRIKIKNDGPDEVTMVRTGANGKVVRLRVTVGSCVTVFAVAGDTIEVVDRNPGNNMGARGTTRTDTP